MVVQQKYNVIDLEKGTLDRRIFTDEQIYQDEMQRIFKRAWLFVGHESIIPNPNDFFASYMGEDPIIVTRDSKGQVHVFLNMCRHRGNRVTRADDGIAKNFMCTYHGWTFSNEGKLVSVPGLQEGYHGELEVEKLGLVEARADTYAGLIFATWDQEAPTLEAYLGNMRWYLDIRFNRRDSGIQAIGPIKWILPCNWKTPIDNAIGDMHHGKATHASAWLTLLKFGKIAGPTNGLPIAAQVDEFSQPGAYQVTPGNGHGLLVALVEEEMRRGPTDWLEDYDRKEWEEYRESTLEESNRRLGRFRTMRIQPGHFAVFPNMFLGLNVAHPRGPYSTEVWFWVDHEMETPEFLKRSKRLEAIQQAQASGMMWQDDMDNWRQVTWASRSLVAQDYPQDISMGLRHEAPNAVLNGVACDKLIAEINQRAFYSRWQEIMNAGSWKDIHIDPITAKFEGTATMKG